MEWEFELSAMKESLLLFFDIILRTVFHFVEKHDEMISNVVKWFVKISLEVTNVFLILNENCFAIRNHPFSQQFVNFVELLLRASRDCLCLPDCGCGLSITTELTSRSRRMNVRNRFRILLCFPTGDNCEIVTNILSANITRIFCC